MDAEESHAGVGVGHRELDDVIGDESEVGAVAVVGAGVLELGGNNSCSPAKAQQSSFPVVPGGVMPPVEGCNKQDYAVLFVIGMAA
jgi:hypothetical protein